MAEVAVQPAPAHFLDHTERWLERYVRPLASVGVLGMLIAATATVADVLLRWLAGTGVLGLNEITSLVFAVAIAACLPAGTAGGVHLKIDIFARWITGRLAAWLDVFGALLLLIFFALLSQRMLVFAGTLYSQSRTTVLLGLPMAPFIFVVVLLLTVSALVQAVIAINKVRQAIAYVPIAGMKSYPVATAIAVLLAIVIIALAGYALLDFAGMSAWAQDNPGKAVGIAFACMWILMLSQVPLAAVTGLIGVVGGALFIGFPPFFSAFATESAGLLTSSQIATLPLFLMMGSFAAVSGLSEDLYELAHVLFGRFRGGLALATIGSCAGFGALTGSSLATAATIGRVAIPEMRARGYSPALATGTCAAGGTLGPLVPPGSGPIIVFAILTEASIGQLFVASVGPAILAVLLYFATIMIYVRLWPTSAPRAMTPLEHAHLNATLRRCLPVALLVFGVMGGLYFGIFTDTESAAVGAIGAFVIAIWRGKINRGTYLEVMVETTATTAMVYAMIIGAQAFSFFVLVSSLTESVTAFIGGLEWNKLALISVILVGYLLLGTVMESFAMMIITVPIITPLIVQIGYPVVWWGIVMMCVVETGMIHPPFGLNVFVLKGITPDVSMWTIYRGVAPFVIADLIKLVLMVLFPAITLWLPGTMHR
ncbi:MAG: TRAP transporter large permease subunit [Xanthobacteraceae bacterium]